jgi:hypothetical protein
MKPTLPWFGSIRKTRIGHVPNERHGIEGRKATTFPEFDWHSFDRGDGGRGKSMSNGHERTRLSREFDSFAFTSTT